MITRLHLLLTVALLTLVGQSTHAQVKLANIFGDNMVLQRNQPLYFFGTGGTSEEVTISFRDQSKSTMVMGDGTWMLKMDPIDVGKPFEVTVKSEENTTILRNVVAGEVWICSGQSNMEWTVARSAKPKEEIAAADYPLIRHVKVINTIATSPLEDVKNTGWSVCSPKTAASYTAVGYYFGRHLHKELDGVPIGLINTSWGGTIVEAWTSGQSLKTHPDFRERVEKIEALSKDKKDLEAKKAAIAKWQREYQKAIQAEDTKWKSPAMDESAWETVEAPALWDKFNKIDGIGWYRKTIQVPDAMAGKEATLSLAMVDDFDQTFVNGTKVGETNGWNQKRVYKIPADQVKAGQVTVAVRVHDTGGGGGIHGSADEMFLKGGGQKVSLAGDWKAKLSEATTKLGPKPEDGGFNGPNNPTAIYNAMVEPLMPVSFRGAIWYQGESNAGRAYQYRTLFPLLIQDWRMKWAEERRRYDQTRRTEALEDKFPFYWVQLANFTATTDQPGGSSWAELREAQSMTLKLPNSGEAVIIDVGEANDIHPKNKQDVGKRLALWALAKNYKKDIVFSGPRYKSMKVDGNKIVLTFDHIGGGLVAKDSVGGKLTQFAICGADEKFVWAEAVIEGDTVVVSSDKVAAPTAVRYAWAQNPDGCNLYNKAGLPASPFRTDSYKGITQY